MKNLIAVIFLTIFSWVGAVSAADDDSEESDKFKIDVEYPVGTNINGGDIFNEDNILPGWEASKTIRVENDSEDNAEAYDANIYFRIDVKEGNTLAGELQLYVVRVEDGSYRIGGENDRYTLAEADGESIYMDKLSATKGKQYRVKIKLDEDAGNEYQGKETKFDVNFRIDQERAGTETEDEILEAEGRGDFTGETPEEEVRGEQEITPEVEEQAAATGDENVAGAQNCNGWPWWVWALILIGYLAVFYKVTFTKKNEKNKNIPWGWQTVLAVAVGFFWWYFDNCREHYWFLYSALGGSGLEYVIFLWTRNKEHYDEAKDEIEKNNDT